jgi:hypothetical protein
MDFIKQLPPSNGYTAILVVIDHLTKESVFMPTTDADTAIDVADSFVTHVFAMRRSVNGWGVGGDAVLSEDMGDEGIGDVYSGISISSRHKNAFLGEVVDNNEDGGVTVGRRKLLDKVHAYRVPWSFRDRVRLKESVWAMARGLDTRAEHAPLCSRGACWATYSRIVVAPRSC